MVTKQLKAALRAYRGDVLRSAVARDRFALLSALQRALDERDELRDFAHFCLNCFGRSEDRERRGVPLHVELAPLPESRLRSACAVTNELHNHKSMRLLSYRTAAIAADGKLLLVHEEGVTVHVHERWATLVLAWSRLHYLPVASSTLVDCDAAIAAFREMHAFLPDVELELPWSSK